ncbi:MAG: hypothetical protein ACOC2U_00810 [bacterium]
MNITKKINHYLREASVPNIKNLKIGNKTSKLIQDFLKGNRFDEYLFDELSDFFDKKDLSVDQINKLMDHIEYIVDNETKQMINNVKNKLN